MTDTMIVLNVGLWVGGERPSLEQVSERTWRVVRFCIEHFRTATGDVHFEGYPATDDLSREDTIVVVFEGYTGWRQDVFDLAEVMKQDCIACHIVFEHLTPKGILIGPNTKPWEPFNYTYFIHPKGTQ